MLDVALLTLPRSLTLQVSATVQMGEAVYMTGAAPSMGSWDLSSAVQLVTTPER